MKHCGLFVVTLFYLITQSQTVSKYLSTLELIRRLGFNGETVQFVTKDGFILKPIRISPPAGCKAKRVAVFLHGQGSAPRVYVVNTKNTPQLDNSSIVVDLCEKKIDRINVGNSLALDLVQLCFEVWLLTFRGTETGLEHVKYKLTDEEFWNYSYDEIIDYDLKGQFDYIQKSSGNEKMTFVGHSFGAPLGLLLATDPKYEKMLASAFLLGPTTPTAPKNEIFKAFNKVVCSLLKQVRHVNGPLVTQPLMFSLQKYTCDKPIVEQIATVLQLTYGYDPKQFDVSHACDYTYYSQMSVKSALHMFQMINSPDGKFRKFDYGHVTNIQKYGSPQVPIYNLSAITLENIAIYYGLNDRMVPLRFVKNWKDFLKVKLKRFSPVKYKRFNHIDFLMGKDVGKILNWEILQDLQEVYCGRVVK